jgi:hypothetical protein
LPQRAKSIERIYWTHAVEFKSAELLNGWVLDVLREQVHLVVLGWRCSRHIIGGVMHFERIKYAFGTLDDWLG